MVQGAAVRRALPQDFDEDDEDVEGDHEEKAIGDEDAGDCRAWR